MHKKEVWPLLLAALSAFCVYTCMYAFRKPFTAASFAGQTVAGIDYKVWLVIAQTLGYTVSKFYGIRYIGELKPARRAISILLFIGLGWLALLLFALVPPPYNILFLVLNGFPLGVIYGLVFSYLEGRRSTELLGAVLASSFIFASGFTQSVGKYILLHWNVSEWWMPFVTGGVFVLPLLFFTVMLNRTPPPTEQDVAQRTRRQPMTGGQRWLFVREFLPGLVLLVAAYVLLTIIRDYRSNFAANMWAELGAANSAAVFTQTEVPASVVTLLLLGLLVLVKNNFTAFMLNHWIIIAGFSLCLGCTLLYRSGGLSAFWWLSVVGVGLYMAYVPFNAMLFDRLIACFKTAGNAGFLIYVADSFGYLGSDAVLLLKNFSSLQVSWTEFFVQLVLAVSLAGAGLSFASFLYFRQKHRVRSPQSLPLQYG